MKRIFITRDIKSGSPLLSLQGKGVHIQGKSLVRFALKPFSYPAPSDWLFFYSRNGVKYFATGLKKLGKELPKAKIGCIGTGTAEAFSARFGKAPDYIGSGKPSQVAKELSSILRKDDSVLFVRAEESRDSVQGYLADGILSEKLTVYTNEIDTETSIPEADIVVVTSPKNVQAYFIQKSPDPDQVFVAIGKTTAGALHAQNMVEGVIATEPSEAGILRAIKIILMGEATG